MNELGEWKVNRKKSQLHLFYGMPIGVSFVLLVWLMSQWLPIPKWMIFGILGLEVLVFMIDGINLIWLTHRIRKVQQGN